MSGSPSSLPVDLVVDDALVALLLGDAGRLVLLVAGLAGGGGRRRRVGGLQGSKDGGKKSIHRLVEKKASALRPLKQVGVC